MNWVGLNKIYGIKCLKYHFCFVIEDLVGQDIEEMVQLLSKVGGVPFEFLLSFFFNVLAQMPPQTLIVLSTSSPCKIIELTAQINKSSNHYNTLHTLNICDHIQELTPFHTLNN